jgi:uncharacterized delta-60 repeat protein
MKRKRGCSVLQALEHRTLFAVTDLDTAFGTGGKALLDHLAQAADNVNQAALTPDNKIVIGGSSIENSIQHATLARLNLDGSLDTSFGAGGQIKLAAPTAFNDLIVNANSTITTLSATSTAPIMTRYTSTGAIDPTFSLSTTPSGTPTDIAPRSDGLLYVTVGNNIMRIDANGIADGTFGVGGVLAIPVESGGVQFRPQKAVALADGSVIVGGVYGTTSPSVSRAAFRHYSSTGVLDSAFGTSGTLQLSSLSTSMICTKLMLDPSGQILATVSDNSAFQGYVSRFSQGGVLDSGFDGDGIATINPSAARSELIGDIVPDGNGGYLGITMIFTNIQNGDGASYIFRLTGSGAVDSNYANSGFSTSFTSPFEFNSGNPRLLLPGDGSLYHVTAMTEPTFFRPTDQYVYKFDASNGARDLSYAGTGRASVGFIGSSSITLTRTSSLMPDGGVAFAGNINDTGSHMLVGRLNSAGQPLSTYWPNGLGTTEVNFGTAQSIPFTTLAQSDGRLIVAGQVINNDGVTSSTDNGIARLNADGTPDPNFGGDGTVVTSFGDSTTELFNHLALRSDGKIYASGNRTIGGVTNSLIVRYSAEGVLETDFGDAGRVNVNFVGSQDRVGEILPAANKKLLVAGNNLKNSGTLDDAFIVRLNSDGSLDTSFGTSGIVTFDIGSTFNSAEQMVTDSSGNIYVVSTVTTSGALSTVQLRKYTPDGQPYAPFGTFGSATYTSGGIINSLSSVTDLKLTPGGRLLMYGRTTGTTSAVDVYVISFDPSSGAIQTSFGTNGKQVYNLSSTTNGDQAADMHIRSDGRWIITGVGVGPGENGNDFAAVSLIGEDSTPPFATLGFDSDPAQKITLQYNEPLASAPTAGSYALKRMSDNTDIPVQQAWLSYDAANRRLTIAPNVLLADSTYQLRALAGGATDVSGNSTTSDFNYYFGVLAGDANHDLTVNSLDFSALASAFNSSSTFAHGDFNYDGKVNALDFNLLAKNFGTTVSLPPAGPATAVSSGGITPDLFSSRAVVDGSEDPLI